MAGLIESVTELEAPVERRRLRRAARRPLRSLRGPRPIGRGPGLTVRRLRTAHRGPGGEYCAVAELLRSPKGEVPLIGPLGRAPLWSIRKFASGRMATPGSTSLNVTFAGA